MTEKATGIEKAAGLGLLVSLAGIVASVVRSKTAAVLIGPDGVGLVAEVQQLATLSLVPLGAFGGAALVQGLAREKGSARVTGAALGWTLLLGIGLAAMMVMAAPALLPVEWSASLRLAAMLAGFAGVCAALGNLTAQVLLFHGRIATTTRQQLIATGAGAVLVVALTWWLGVTGQFIAIALTPVVVLIPGAWSARATGSWPSPAQVSLDRSFLRTASTIGVSSLIAAAALQGALYSTRWQLELAGGVGWNGQFQAAWSIGSMYLTMVLSGLGNFAFPRYATAESTEALQAELDTAAGFVAKYAPPIVLLAATFAGLGIKLLYSSRFDPAIDVLRWQLAGDVAKCFAWVYAGPLLYRGKVRAFLLSELTAAVLLGGLPWLLVPTLGLAGTGVAYLLTYAGYLALTVAITRASLGVHAQPQHLALAFGSTALLAAIAFFPPTIAVQAIATVMGAAWLWRVGAFSLVLRRVLRVKA